MNARRTRRARCHRDGFTLIELLAASALAAVLMLVLFQVIGSLGRTRAALERAGASLDSASAVHVPWKSDLVELLRWDLVNADDVRLEPGVVALDGHGALDRRRALAAAHQPVGVRYAVQRRGGRSCLVRWQSSRDGAEPEATWAEVVCVDVSRFDLAPVAPARAASLPPVLSALVRGGADPRDVPLRLRLDGPSGPLLDETIVIR